MLELTAKEVFLKVKARIEQGWTQHAFARDKDGKSCFEQSDDACTWCISGALSREYYSTEHRFDNPTYTRTDDAIRNALYTYLPAHSSVSEIRNHVSFNDHPSTTKQDMLNYLDACIAACDKK